MDGSPLTPARIQAVLQEIPALVLVLDAQLQPAFAREEGAERLGPGVEPILREVLETGEIARVPSWESGDCVWDLVVVPLRDAPGDPVEGLVVHAVDVTRMAEAEHRFVALFRAETMGVTISDETNLLEANDAFLAMVGRTREELDAGLRWTELTAPESSAYDQRALGNLLGGVGETIPYEKEYLRRDGSRVAVMIHGTLLSAEPLRVLATVFELTERKAAEREVATLLARTARLQEITASLSATNSAAEISRAVIHHGLEELTASAGILVRREAFLRVEHAVGFPPDVVEQWRSFPATLPAPLRSASAAPSERLPPHVLDGTLRTVRLVVADRHVGTLGVAFRGNRELSDLDADFLASLAHQAAAALDRARLYENRAYVARKLQEGLLPQQLADIPGLEAAVVYESISGGGEVGGDFYDLFEATPGRWALAIGDVCGKGTEAAVITGLARHTVRAVARVTPEPAAVLEFLNGALRRHGGPPQFCTVGFAVLQPSGDGFEALVTSGGHPYPYVLRASGKLDEIEVTGTMLGVSDDPRLETVPVQLSPGDALVFYTDGVTDARLQGGERFGEERLLEALRGAAGGDAGDIARAVEAAVRAHHPGTSADDRAIVVLRVVPR
jgi:PAS domain S-box-containing protein